MKNNVCAVDLFCGAGGLTHGLKQAGIDVKVGVDIEKACEYPYAFNNEATFLLKSVVDVEAEELSKYLDDADYKLLAGCAPCQTFSTYNQKASSEDDRWWLLKQFSRIVDELAKHGDLAPEFITMENVPGLAKQKVFDEFVEDLESLGYRVWHRVVNCANYGLPQSRRRLVLLASRLGEIELLSPEELSVELKTVRDVIDDLPPLTHGGVDENDPLHQASVLSDINYRRMLKSKPGGTWRDWKTSEDDEDLRAECHRKESGKTYLGVYARMEWNKPAPTMTTQYYGFGNGRFGHPAQHRAISLREGAVFQGFPKDYQFVRPGETISKKAIGRMIGNAVPVKLGEVIGKSILAHIERYSMSDSVVV